MKESIKEIIKSVQARSYSQIIKRDQKLPEQSGKVVSVIGARRSGKTYLLFQTIAELLKTGIKKEQIVYLNFEDERLDFLAHPLDLILQAYRELYPEINLEECYFFFDEVQNVENWDKFVRRVYDSVSKNIFITGSNARLLSTEIATSLRGRAISFTTYPLSLKEFLRFKKIDADVYVNSNKAKIFNAFDQYLYQGGFPETVNMNAELARKTLQEYLNVMIYRDLVERFQISNPNVLKYFIKRVFASMTTITSLNKIYNELKSMGLKVSKDKIYEYLQFTREVFIHHLTDKFDASPVKRERSDKKVYVIDNGLISANSFSLSKDSGKLLENLVAMELLKSGGQFTYFKKKKECDFIMMGHEQTGAIQVSYEMTESTTKEREVKGLVEACQYLDTKEGMILTLDHEEELEHQGVKISILPAYKYFLK